ncbi:MAG: DNA gyrase inhibitor YacG [Pseudomonadota bacterium]|nr:DNA gyrase inhibitor YacG [Pseudomonadota bacterium]
MTTDRPIRVSRCPMCGKPTIVEMRPFCSKRCANLDLKHWLSEDYVMPGTEPADPDEDPSGTMH